MPAADRPGFIDRLYSAYRAFQGREEAALAQPGMIVAQSWGQGALWKPQESLDAYGYNVWLYRSVLTLAMELSRVPLRLQRQTAGGEVKFLERHQALDVLARPQETKSGKCQLSGMLLRVISNMHLLLNGEAFWVFQKKFRQHVPTYLDLALPECMFEVLDKDNEIEKYVYRVAESGRETHIPALDVVHFRLPSPKKWIRGHSPLQSIRYAIDTQRKADEMNTKKLDNYAVPPGVLATEQNIPEAERKKIGQQWQEAMGGVKNAGKVPVMPSGLEFKRIAESNQEMEFTEGKRTTRDEILANFGIGPEMMGRTESQTRANAEAAIFVFQRFGVLPYLELFVDALNNDYLPAFPGTDGLTFSFPDPVPENLEEKRLTAENLFNGGALTPNERRKMFGMEPLQDEGMDVPYLPINLMPVGADPVTPDAPAEEPQ